MAYPRMASLKTPKQLRERLAELDLQLPFDETIEIGQGAPLQKAIDCRERAIGNRFCILPMEGWDGTGDGKPTELTRRRWENFGISGAKLLWGCEAVAVRQDGRANPNQLLICENNLADLESMREQLVAAHVERFERHDDLLVGLQLTHSGRFARPNSKTQAEPRTVYRHPVLDSRVGVQDDSTLLSDDQLKALTDDFILASQRAAKIGFDFVDIKHCHGYLGHELLSGYDRPGTYGGSFENRTRFLREIVAGIKSVVPRLGIGVRLSIFDFVPFATGENGIGEPQLAAGQSPFGADASGLDFDLSEPFKLMELLQALDIRLVCTTAGSPYYNPHIQRPAYFPPSDGYLPPEDPLVGVVRQVQATAEIKKRFPSLIVVGSGFSYLQEWTPNVGQALLRSGMVDSIGLGRMVLSYPDLPADVLSGRPLQRKKICRTFSECTTAPRNGMVSGCFPLDPFYQDRPERARLKSLKLRT